MLQKSEILRHYHKSEHQIQDEWEDIKQAQLNPLKFDVLYERYYNPIFVFVYRRVNDEDVCADITSQVFFKAMVSIKKYIFKGLPFSAWLYRIAFNEINLYFRSNKADRFVSIEQSGIASIINETHEDNNEVVYQKMMLAIQKLKKEELELVELRFFEKHSFAEIAEIMNITENNAKVKVYRILDKIKKLMY